MKDLVDRYTDITRRIKNLEETQSALAAQIKAKGAGRYEGTSVALQVTSVAGRKTTNWAGVCAEAGVPPAIVAKHTAKGEDSLRPAAVSRIMNKLGIDAPTKGVKALIRRLKRLKTTECVVDGGAYREDMSDGQVLIDTSWTEKELEDWLYRTKGIDYIGVFVRSPQ